MGFGAQCEDCDCVLIETGKIKDGFLWVLGGFMGPELAEGPDALSDLLLLGWPVTFGVIRDPGMGRLADSRSLAVAFLFCQWNYYI